jgi:hypothetical protein
MDVQECAHLKIPNDMCNKRLIKNFFTFGSPKDQNEQIELECHRIFEVFQPIRCRAPFKSIRCLYDRTIVTVLL